MKKEQEKIYTFNLHLPEEVRITHGYNIFNSFPVHFHQTYTLGLIEKGERLFNYRNEISHLKVDSVFLVQPFEPHSCTSPGNILHSYKIISFDFAGVEIRPYFKELIVEDQQLLEEIKQFHELAEYNKDDANTKLIWQRIKEKLLSISEPGKNTEEALLYKPGIKKAKEYICANCKSQLLLSDVAKMVNMSEFYFNRVFHQMIGMSPYAYLLFCRVKKSQEILLGGESVTSSAYEAGFFDQSHFIRLFRKHTGVTPGSFLKINKENQSKNR